jgi:HlyD family secretion protein
MKPMESIAKQPPTALRTAAPAPDEVAKTNRPATEQGAPHRVGRRLVSATAIMAALALVVFLSWWFYFSPVTVSLAPVEANLREQVYGLGVIGARVQSNVGFKVPGVLVELDTDQGYRVRAGQVLARLDARDIEAQVAVAKAGVAQARANVDKAKADVASAMANFTNASRISARDARLIKNGVVSEEQTETDQNAVRVTTANVAVAQSEVAQAAAALQSAEAQEAFEEATLAYYTLYAPYDAWVISRNLELGSMPNPGQSVFTLVAAHTVWVVGYVDERLAGRLNVGQPAEIVLRSDPNKHIPGHVERIEIQSDPVNEERLVDVAFDQIPDNIHLAEQAYVYIITNVLPRAVAVQPAAVADLRDGHATVWTVENGRLDQRRVTVGPELLDGRLPIVDGLPAAAAVVAAPVSGRRVGRAADIAEASGP